MPASFAAFALVCAMSAAALADDTRLPDSLSALLLSRPPRRPCQTAAAPGRVRRWGWS